MVFRGLKSKKQRKNKEQSLDSLVCKFVFDGLGNPLGESVSIDKDLIIIKAESSFLGIPLKHVEVDGKKVIVKGLVDQKNAKQLGRRWESNELKKKGVFYHKK